MKSHRKYVVLGLLAIVGATAGMFSTARCLVVQRTDVVPLASSGPLKLSELTVNSNRTGLYEKFEISFDLAGDWDNPFDPDQIKVDALFTAPDGKQLAVPAFFYQEYIQNVHLGLDKVGAPMWKARFTPTMAGQYRYQVVADNRGQQVKSAEQEFTSVPFHDNRGFLRISKTNPLYFEFDDGTPFFAVSMDNATNDVPNYERVYKRFSSSGGNYNRLFIQYGQLDVGELLPRNAGADRGLGKMNLDLSWKLDRVIELGEAMGIYHQLCMTNQYNFNTVWARNVFNKANGGILDSKNEYVTSESAMKFVEKRFRYIVARWGYSPSVFSWNLWNEWSAMGTPADAAVAWHRRMANYIASIDAFHHVIHTNDGKLNGTPEVNAMPEMEVISTNGYGIKNIAEASESWTRRLIAQFKKPYVLAEFGIGHSNVPRGGYAGADPERIMIHDAHWSPLMSGSAGTGMAWEGNWIDNQLFYRYTSAVSKIVSGVPFSKRQWTPVKVASFKFADSRAPYYGDVIVEGWNPTGNYGMPPNASQQESFQIDKDGRVEPHEFLSAVLTGAAGVQSGAPAGRPGRNIPSVTFKMEYPDNGELVVFVSDIPPGGAMPQLTVTIDGAQALKKDYTAGEYEYIQYYPIAIAKGPHTVRVENSGAGRFTTSFELKKYLYKTGPDLEVRGMQTDDYILLWLKNQKFTWLHEITKIALRPQPEGVLELENVPDGSWVAQWVNTLDATNVKRELVVSKGQKLVLKTPSTEKSVAVRLHKI